MSGVSERQCQSFHELPFESLYIALQISDNQEKHSLEDAMNEVQFKLAHVKTIFVVKEHESRMDYVYPNKLFSDLIFVKDQRYGDFTDIKIDRVEYFIDCFIFTLTTILDNHLSANLYLVLF